MIPSLKVAIIKLSHRQTDRQTDRQTHTHARTHTRHLFCNTINILPLTHNITVFNNNDWSDITMEY